jgi:hypothetical protein
VNGDTAVDHQAGAWTIERCSAVGSGWKTWTTAPALTRLAELFNNSLTSSFLMVHNDGTTIWFNKERFEELLKWLVVMHAFDAAREKIAPSVPVTELQECAAAAGYRVPVLLQMTEELWNKEA